MNRDRQHAIQYLRAKRDGLWHWTENGAVLAWSDGTTIAFREEIIQILEWLAPNGLPSFGAIVFLLAACRGKVPNVADVIAISDSLPTGMGKEAAVLVGARSQLRAQLTAALDELRKLSQLTAEINSGIKAKCVLAEAVFEPAKVERHIEARAVLLGMRKQFNDSDLVEAADQSASANYVRQIDIVAEGLKLHTAESLALRLRTGLDALPNEADANLPAAERARRLIEDLSRDREFGSVARAARELMAAIKLPRRLGQRDQLALGGVADITNRGPLDRLLVSELAHDDLTLSVRIALNEVLYLRREPPMREPPGTLALLLDSGVRLWGVPRVLATAVALALIARDKQHSQILAWRAGGKELHPVDLLSRNGLTQHLGVVEPVAHAGDSIAAFAAATSTKSQNQSVLVTHRDALEDSEFRRALAEQPDAPAYVATVDREGHFELHLMPLSHRPPICQSDLDVASIFDESAAVPPIKVDVDANLPAIFGLSPFPFLLPATGNVEFWTKGGDGLIYAVMNDRRIVCYCDQQSGGRVLANDLPGGKTIWMDCDGTELHVVKIGTNQRPTRLLSMALPYGQLRVIDLINGADLHAIHRSGDALLVIRSQDVRAYSLSDGRLLGQEPNRHYWLHGRYFRYKEHFYFAAWDGERVKFEPVTIPCEYLPSSVSAIFDRDGYAGPWMLCQSGNVVSTESGQVIKLPRPTDVELHLHSYRISKDGRRLLVLSGRRDTQNNRHYFCLFDLESLNSRAFNFCHEFPDDCPPRPNWPIYTAVKSIALLKDGVAFCGRKNRWRKLGLDGRANLHISPITDTNNLVPLPAFKPPKKTKYGCTLEVAELDNSRKLFLDSRGLLHLKHSNPSVPEVSIVLSATEVAAWTSDGYVCGPRFFFEGATTPQPLRVFERIMNFFTRP